MAIEPGDGCAPAAELTIHTEAIMRALIALLALLGIAGIAVGVLTIIRGMSVGVLTIIRGMSGPDGVPFQFENYGGPGPIIAGIVVLATSLYLLSFWRRRE
jgi:hypothetical protein